MEQEDNLYDYVKIFWQDRKLFFWIIGLFVGATILLLLFGPKLYKIEKIMQIGQMSEIKGLEGTYVRKLIENPRILAEKLIVVYDYKRVEAKTPTPFITITLKGFNKEKLKEKEKLLEKRSLTDHHRIYQQYLNGMKSHIKALEKKIGEVKEEIDILEANIQKLFRTMTVQDNVTSKSILLERKDYFWKLNVELNQYLGLLKKDDEIYPSKFINEFSEIKHDIRWPIAILAIMFGTGLLLAIAISLLKSFNLRKE